MTNEAPPLSVLMKRSGISFYTRRVLQRWHRGEISTDAARELLEPGEVERLVAWVSARAP